MQKIAAVHDIAGLSRTSLNVVLPIITALGIQVVPLPTAILSSGTNGFEDFYFADLTASMHGILEHWKRMPLRFNGVYSGFLGSPEQVKIVAECVDTCLEQEGLFIVDPVMGDDGILEPTMGPDMVEHMRWLCSKAFCITPNVTEAALLLGEKMPNTSKQLDREFFKDWLVRLCALGPEVAVITSIQEQENNHVSVVAYDKRDNTFWRVSCEYIPAMYPGTGDCFTSVLTGNLLRGEYLPVAIARAVHFVQSGVRLAYEQNTPQREGLLLDQVIKNLFLPTSVLPYSEL